ncbi:TPA: hypothetical protein RSW61_001918 [Vibrio harveyi]|nr:hypothetical protein [Vibrio harveyi]
MKRLTNEQAIALGLPVINKGASSDASLDRTERKLTPQEAQSLGLPSSPISPEEQYAQQAEMEYQQSLDQTERDTSKDTVWGYTGAPVTEGITRGTGEFFQTIDDLGTSLFGEDSLLNQPLWGTRDEMLQDTLRSEADRIQETQVADSGIADFIGDASQFATGWAATPVRGVGLATNIARGSVADASTFAPEDPLLTDYVSDVDSPWARRAVRAAEGAGLGLVGEGVVRGGRAISDARKSSQPLQNERTMENIIEYVMSPLGKAQIQNTNELLRVNTAREKLAGADSLLEQLRGKKQEDLLDPHFVDYREGMIVREWEAINRDKAIRNVDETTGERIDPALIDTDRFYYNHDDNHWYPKPSKADISAIRQRTYREAMDAADSLQSQSIMNMSMGSKVSDPLPADAPFTQKLARKITHRKDGTERIAPSLTGLNPQMREAIGLGQGQFALLKSLEFGERTLPLDIVNFIRGKNLDTMIEANKKEIIGRIDNELNRLERTDWKNDIYGREDRRIHKSLTNIKHKFENNQSLDAADVDALKAGGARIGSISPFRNATTEELNRHYESSSLANRVMGHSRLLAGLKGSQGVDKLAQGASLLLPYFTSGLSVPISIFSSIFKSHLERKLYDKVRSTAAYGRYMFKIRQANRWIVNRAINAAERDQVVVDAMNRLENSLESELALEGRKTGIFRDAIIETLNEYPSIVQSAQAASRQQLAEEEE